MTTTTNLTITHLQADQEQPEDTENESKDILDGALAGLLTHNMASDADYTLATTGTVPYEWQNMVVTITDTTSPQVLTATRNIIVPAKAKLYVFKNDTAQSLVLAINGSPLAGITVATAKTAILNCTGSAIIRITADA